MSAIAETRRHEIRTRGGRVLAVREAGDPAGDLVLCHHGTPGGATILRAWADDAAARGLRLVSWDRPGYGGSTRHAGRRVADVAADAATIADALGAASFTTYGASGGGPHALACGALLKDRCRAVAVVAGVCPFHAEGLDWRAGMGEDNVVEFDAAQQGEQALRAVVGPWRQGILAASQAEMEQQLDTLLPDVDRAVLHTEVGAAFHASMQDAIRPGVDGWVDDDLAFVADWGFEVADVAVPTLVLQGGQDLMVPEAHGRWLAAHVPSCEPRFPAEHGHLSLGADPAPVLSWVAEH